ncbi:MAG: hypothetical protein SF069_17850 [Phycisphaerae bacterium]|nr:hypothetical protein [Phycisphaerae bacterium]
MGNEIEIPFIVAGGVVRIDGKVSLPDGVRGVAILRPAATAPNGHARAEALDAIRRIGEAGVLNSGGLRLTRDEMHERD